jgi:hypothetical protein
MNHTTEDLLNATLALPEGERLKIAGALLASLAPDRHQPTNGAGSAEAQPSPDAVRAAEIVTGEEQKVNRMALITLANWQPETPLPPPPNPPKYEWPADVWEFAVRHQVAGYLDPLMDAARRNFPNAERVSCYLEGDPEIPEEWHIVYEVRIPGLHFPGPDLDSVLAAQKQYSRDKFRICPAPLNCLFRLHLDYVDP